MPYVMTLLVQENRQVEHKGGSSELIPELRTHHAWIFDSFNAAKASFRRKITELQDALDDAFADGAYQPLARYCRRMALAPDHPAVSMAEATAKLLTDPFFEGELPDWCGGTAEDWETLLCSGGRVYHSDMDTLMDCNALSMSDPNAAYRFHFCEIEPIRGREIQLLLQKAVNPGGGGNRNRSAPIQKHECANPNA